MYKNINKNNINKKEVYKELVLKYFGEEVYNEFMQINDYNVNILCECLDIIEKTINNNDDCAVLKTKFIEELNYIKKFD